ncbi:hypothetical protein [Sphingomonas nostoxanthinifaciens]|uniref:hypothetical protein n=1 Tax=Sphingomonas nostoxanthinifaciens TaxID=2872652 RepID=UPI001CC1E2A5|nr:hypothetical protein [Sphingomonas nostoxanthinifaciens]UAK22858.1 hypothetical protein K8P63_10415 [Sphingomonas nostoxanthinifaciens]
MQNAYITLAPGTIGLQLELTAGPKVAGTIIAALDANGDRKVAQAEARAFADRVLSASRLTVDGHPLSLRVVSADVPSYAALLGAHGTIKIVATARWADRPGTSTLIYHNGYSPAESRCDANIFMKQANSPSYRVIAQQRSDDGRSLVVRYATSRV